MTLSKPQLTIKLEKWLKNYIKSNLSSKYELLDLITPETTLAKINSDLIKNLVNYSAWEFTPDLLAIVKEKSSHDIKLIMVSRYTSSVSLRDIGAAYTFAKLTKAPIYFIISTKGVSNEVNILLVDDNIRKRLLKVNQNVNVFIGTYKEDSDTIDDSWVSSEGFGTLE